MIFQRFPFVVAALLLGLQLSTAHADLFDYGLDPQKSQELSEIVTKNADVRNAIAAFERGDLPECERLLQQALKSEKNLPAVDVMVSRLLMSKGQINEALTRLELYLRKGVKDPEAHSMMGEIALMSGRTTDAWLQFREALSLVTNSSNLSKARKDAFVNQLLRLRAETAERRMDIEMAQQLYRELEKASPESGFPLSAQARLLIGGGDITRGAELLRRAKKLDKNAPQPELQIALALANGTDKEETEKWFRDGIKQSETVTIANWFEYLKWLLTQDRAVDVQYLIERAPENFRKDRLLRLLDAIALRFLGKNEDAEKGFSVLLSEDASDMEAADQLALILVESIDQGKKVRAQQLSQNNLRRMPNNENAIATAAWVEFRLGATDIADQYFNSLMARGTQNPQIVYYVGRILESRGRTEDANTLYKNAIEMPGLFVQRNELRTKLGIPKKDASKSAASNTPKSPSPPTPAPPPAADTKSKQAK